MREIPSLQNVKPKMALQAEHRIEKVYRKKNTEKEMHRRKRTKYERWKQMKEIWKKYEEGRRKKIREEKEMKGNCCWMWWCWTSLWSWCTTRPGSQHHPDKNSDSRSFLSKQVAFVLDYIDAIFFLNNEWTVYIDLHWFLRPWIKVHI